MCEVTDHLLVTPKKHVDKLASLTKPKQNELIDILVRYEDMGYNVFFREPKNIIKTVNHHHTHLIKLGKRIKSLQYTKEPYNMKYKTV
jgi:diadenosine tetraphosphate (Ap4A) HIT family hydrolase